MDILSRYIKIKIDIESYSSNVPINLIVVTKGRTLSDINQIINSGHFHFGENRVQQSVNKWKDTLNLNPNIKLHFIGKLQTNKVLEVIKYFSFVHSLDNPKLALKIYNVENHLNKKLEYFIQVNLAEEKNKSGILKSDVTNFVNYCRCDLKLNIIGLMCIPPINEDSKKYFIELNRLAKNNNLKDLSMGMSNDYISAIQNGSTFVRIGSGIFGK